MVLRDSKNTLVQNHENDFMQVQSNLDSFHKYLDKDTVNVFILPVNCVFRGLEKCPVYISGII